MGYDYWKVCVAVHHHRLLSENNIQCVICFKNGACCFKVWQLYFAKDFNDSSEFHGI